MGQAAALYSLAAQAYPVILVPKDTAYSLRYVLVRPQSMPCSLGGSRARSIYFQQVLFFLNK